MCCYSSSFNTQYLLLYLLLFAGNRSFCYVSGTGRSFHEGGRRLEAQSLPERNETCQGESCLVTKVGESVSVCYSIYLLSFLARWLLQLLSQHCINFTVCSLHLQETGAVAMPASTGQFPPSMKKKVLEPLSSQEEMESVSLLCRG